MDCIGLVGLDQPSTKFSVVIGRKSLETLDQFYIYTQSELFLCSVVPQHFGNMCTENHMNVANRMVLFHTDVAWFGEKMFYVGRRSIIVPSYITSGNGMRFVPQESCSLTHLFSEFFPVVASTENRLAELFRVVRGLFQLIYPISGEEHMEARYDRFAKHFVEKTDQIWHDLDTTSAVSSDAPGVPAYPTIGDSFQFVETEEVDKIL